MIRRILRAAALSLRLQIRARFPQVYAILTLPVVIALLFAVPPAAVAWAFPLFLFAEPPAPGPGSAWCHRRSLPRVPRLITRSTRSPRTRAPAAA